MNDLDLSALATGPVPSLLPADAVRARGEQRRQRTRAVVAGAAALVVVAGAGTAVALAGGGKPQSLQVADPPTPVASPEPTATATPRYQPKITWAAFPSVFRMNELVSGDWVSGPVQDYDFPDEYDRCDATKMLDLQRTAVVSRHLNTTDGKIWLTFTVEDYATRGDAGGAFSQRLSSLRSCPTVVTDGPGLGSQETSTVVASSATSYTVDRVQRECQQDHAQCSDVPESSMTVRSGHLLLSVTSFRPGAAVSRDRLAAVEQAFSEAATATYGKPVIQGVTPTAVTARVGASYYGAVLWMGDKALDVPAFDEAQAQAAEWGPVTEAPLSCFDDSTGGPAAQQSSQDALVLLFDTSQQAEQFANLFEGRVGSVAKLTVRCLG